MLLDPSSEFGEFESHTGLKIIRGIEDVHLFFQQLNRGRITEEIKWIDFNDLEMVKELTPLEISELLYFWAYENASSFSVFLQTAKQLCLFRPQKISVPVFTTATWKNITEF